MAFASVSFRPYLASAQVFKSMAHSNTQRGLNTSTKGEFIFTQRAGLIRKVKTIEETRREKLQMLVKQHGGTANLCEKLGYSRVETSKLTRIANGNIRHDRGGKPYELGSATARFIEEALLLERGWMDTPPTLSEQYGHHDTRAMVMEAMDHLPQEHHATVLRLVNALVQPATPANGTNG